MQFRQLQKARLGTILGAAGLIAAATACGSSNSATPIAPVASASPTSSAGPVLPTTVGFAQTNVATPAAAPGGGIVTLPLPPSSGYAGTASLALATIPGGLRLTVTYANKPPTGVTSLATTRMMAGERLPLESQSTNVAYACIAVNELITIGGRPHLAFALPAAFADPRVRYYVALNQGSRWAGGYGGPAVATTSGASADLGIDGRFGFVVPAKGKVCVALYGRYSTAPTPVPATPQPSSTTSASPSASPTMDPSASPSSTPYVSPSPSPTPTPTTSPTATPTPAAQVSVSSSALLFTSLAQQVVTVSEARYTGTFTQTNTCSGIATISGASASGPVAAFTVTPVAGGSCSVMFANGLGATTTVAVGVTTISIPVR